METQSDILDGLTRMKPGHTCSVVGLVQSSNQRTISTPDHIHIATYLNSDTDRTDHAALLNKLRQLTI